MLNKFKHVLRLTLLLPALMLSNQVIASVILQYHHVSDTLPSVTSISPKDFDAHLAYLKHNQFNVISLPDMLTQLKNGKILKDNTVAITFDDGYKNNYLTAAPLLEKYGFPYTIFVNPKLIDEKISYAMTWEQIRALAKKGATIANHSAEHVYLHQLNKGENKIQWQKRIKQDLEQSEQRIKQETGHNYRYLAYPYGEFNHALQNIIKELGYVGIGQHSGAVGIHNDFSRLPRFPASGIYANLKTLKSKLKSLPFNLKILENSEPVTTNKHPKLVLQLAMNDFNQSQFVCYVSGQGKAKLNWIATNIVEVSAVVPLKKGRSRYNCTAPSLDQKGYYYWFSQPWIITSNNL
ncbi:polysaccharide deacetylase family protein [Pseudoalteromonas denitrificans]|nr:polysaccharide deacetylase family protein [Pseudoalteromonas denitrificans]